ncbi:transcriptional regulator, LysR family [Ancylobacter novellus DSM 506]|uniref:Transcriptional regulator, LysR family n=1 Tax=Ancylobacter novellus (strain ATCC 8093 / DSM 506 / JCM 20403 / CCM 1077 / IAM 12100 / NBRC 12443 / NCIMB 10456) TaxID=639283 RepID=D7A1W3_ANCN5|nr:LysR family transcriptional regulator [Ancylobacter novellus]ADH87579.1 transcriptional regulator, LysR family [Ancylobacter novellus DSM 506]
MTDRPLDLELVRAFVHVAELSSFTRAAEALGSTQAGVSLRLRKLEDRLGRTLLERTPRLVRLTPDGAQFLERARRLLAADRDARLWGAPSVQRLRLGISDHTTGDTLPGLLSRLAAVSPEVVFDIRMGFSRVLLDAFDAGELDAIVVRREGDRRAGEMVRQDRYGWFAAGEARRGSAPLPLALLAAPCGVRAAATGALDAAGIAWREAFTGGSVSSVAAAVAAGLAVAPMAAHLAPAGSVDVGPALGLPALPSAKVMLIARAADAPTRAALCELAAFLRAG